MKNRALALVELLVVMAIMITVMTLVARYLAEQRDLTVRTQARSEVQDRVRLVMQLVVQDLQLVGSQAYVNTSGAIIDLGSTLGCANDCLTSTNSGIQDSFGTKYVSKLWAGCRSVAYSFDSVNADLLRRSDVACGSNASPINLAKNVLALDIRYKCSDGTTQDESASCPGGSARTAQVMVIGKSPISVSSIPASSFTTPSSNSPNVSCAATYICMALNQEILMPNLKD